MNTIPPQTLRPTVCVGSVALVFIMLCIQFACKNQLLFLKWYIIGPSRESVNAVDHLLAFFSPLVLKPGALMFQHADVGKCSAAPVVVSVCLVLPLQSPSTAAWWHAAAGTGAARASVFKHTDLQLKEEQMSRIISTISLLTYEAILILGMNSN